LAHRSRTVDSDISTAAAALAGAPRSAAAIIG
jgi:hypothetical protein